MTIRIVQIKSKWIFYGIFRENLPDVDPIDLHRSSEIERISVQEKGKLLSIQLLHDGNI